MRMIALLLGLASFLMTGPAFAQYANWGVLDEIARREWTTEKEPRPRITRFRWIEPGRVLEARHGFVSRLQFGDAKFADTVQRFVRNPATGSIDVTYSYEDGRPPLKAVIRIQPDGSAIESFTDASGVRKRNIYRSPTLALNVIERQEMKADSWAVLGQTRKTGLTQEEIAENSRRIEERRRMEIAAAQARRAAEEAQRAAEEAEQQAAYEAQEAERQAANDHMRNSMNAGLMDAIRGIGTAVQERNQQRAELERLRLAAQQETARRRADEARREADRITQENNRRMAEANARQQAMAQQNATRTAPATLSTNVDAERVAHLQNERKRAEAASLEQERQRRADEANRQKQAEQAEAARQAEAKRQAEARRVADAKRREEEAARPVAFREGVVLCKEQRANYFRCDGPLQVTYSDLSSTAGMASLRQACGSNSAPNPLGGWAGYRAYGCGFGIHPTNRTYPGNRDVPAALGVGNVPGTRTYYCPRSVSAYCRGG